MSKILVIDDESWLREMIRLALEQQGFDVIESVDSTDGTAKARQFLPDLILCDVNMGKADAGYETLTKLREDAATAAIPFILMTGMADSAGMRHGMELGADDYLPKPFKVDELYAAVNARLEIVATDADSVIALRSARIASPAGIVRPVAISQAEMVGRLPDLKLELMDGPLAMAEEYFKKIIAELVQNAFKFSEPGTAVRASLKLSPEEVEFSVHDRGRGLSTEHVQRIDAYVQFERKMRDQEGLGLGLAIAKKLAELHGGRLAISSSPETGTTVTVKLPRPKH